MHIGRRIYYDLVTGDIIIDTGERSGSVVETSIEQDFRSYAVLSERDPSTVGMIQLEYGQFADDFMHCSGYRVDLDTRELLFSYPDPNETDAASKYKLPVSEEIVGLKEDLLLLQSVIDVLILGGDH